jgi:predicted neuraminidase
MSLHKPQARLVHVYKGTPGNHCVCDQALRQMPDGSWAIIFMTGGNSEPERENHIAICRSTDNGETWSAPKTLLQFEDRGCLLSEVMVHQNTITIFGHSHLGFFEDWQCFTLTSTDNGHTWSAPKPFKPLPRRTFVRNLYISTWGTWYLPFQTYDVQEDPFPSHLKDGSNKKGLNGTLISQDQGQTWEKSELIGPQAGWNENNLTELSDGRLIMLCRADGTGRLSSSESTDQGHSWTPWQSTQIPNPGSKFRLHRLKDERIVLIHNPNSNARMRNPLSLWISDNDMKTWDYKHLITDFPGRLSYPDGFVEADESQIHFAFDYNRHDLIAVSAPLP